MYTKAAFLKTVKLETKIIKHLASLVPANSYDYRPTPGQRSTLELLRYLTTCGATSAIYAATGTWDHYEKMDAEAKQLQPADIAKALDKQARLIAKAVKPFSDAKMQKTKVKTWAGATITLGEGLIDMVLKQLVAYRMQLFLYAKASGASDLGTSDVWMGRRPKPKKAAASA
jgi:hypothetical protein